MANGTIAFDTLQTSGQITGTAKSVDTDYVVNGSAKAWNNTDVAGTTINESFAISSLTDTDTGRQTHNVTSNFDTTTYCPQMNLEDNNYNQQWISDQQVNSWRTNNYDGSAYQDARVLTIAFGDLA